MKIINFRNLKWLWYAILLMLLDIGSKYWIKTNFYVGEILFLSSYCNCYYVHNSGLAFGLFADLNLFHHWLFVWITVLIIVVFIIFLCESVKYLNKYYCFAHSMIIGGALGNLYDRVLCGVVIDFIDLHIKDWHWPTFNVADTEICIGMIILIIRHYCVVFRKNLFNES